MQEQQRQLYTKKVEVQLENPIQLSMSRIGRGQIDRYTDRFNIAEIHTAAKKKKPSLQQNRGRLFNSDGKNCSSVKITTPLKGSTSFKRSNYTDFRWKSKPECANYEEYNDQLLDEYFTILSRDSKDYFRKFPKLEEDYHAVILDGSELRVVSNEIPTDLYFPPGTADCSFSTSLPSILTNNIRCNVDDSSQQSLWKPDDIERQAFLSKVMLSCRAELCVPGTVLQASLRNRASYVCVLGPYVEGAEGSSSDASTESTKEKEDMIVVFDGENNRAISAFKCSPLVAEDDVIAILEDFYSSNVSDPSSFCPFFSHPLYGDDNAIVVPLLLMAAKKAVDLQWNVSEVAEYLRTQEMFHDDVIKIYYKSTIPQTRSMQDLIKFHEYFLALTRTTTGQDSSKKMLQLFRRAEIILGNKVIGSVSPSHNGISNSSGFDIGLTLDDRSDINVSEDLICNDIHTNVSNVMNKMIRLIEKSEASPPRVMCGYNLLCVTRENKDCKYTTTVGNKNETAVAYEVQEPMLILPTLETLEIWDDFESDTASNSSSDSDSDSDSSSSEQFDEYPAETKKEKQRICEKPKAIISAAERKRMMKTRPIEQLDIITGLPVRRYPNSTNAAAAMGIPTTAIFTCCTIHTKSSHNYRWRFYEGAFSKDWNEGMESLECLKAIVQGPYIPRKQSKIPSLDRSDAIEILENDLQGEIGNCRAGNGGNNVRSNVIAAAGGNQHENNSSSATVHSKEPKTPNKLEKSNKSLKGPGQGEIGYIPKQGLENKFSTTSYKEHVERISGLTYRQIVIIALSKMSPHEETSPDQGSLFSDIELKVIHLFPMISICTDVSRMTGPSKQIIQQAILLGEHQGEICSFLQGGLKNLKATGIKSYQLSVLGEERLSILRTVLALPISQNQTGTSYKEPLFANSSSVSNVITVIKGGSHGVEKISGISCNADINSQFDNGNDNDNTNGSRSDKFDSNDCVSVIDSKDDRIHKNGNNKSGGECSGIGLGNDDICYNNGNDDNSNHSHDSSAISIYNRDDCKNNDDNNNNNYNYNNDDNNGSSAVDGENVSCDKKGDNDNLHHGDSNSAISDYNCDDYKNNVDSKNDNNDNGDVNDDSYPNVIFKVDNISTRSSERNWDSRNGRISRCNADANNKATEDIAPDHTVHQNKGKPPTDHKRLRNKVRVEDKVDNGIDERNDKSINHGKRIIVDEGIKKNDDGILDLTLDEDSDVESGDEDKSSDNDVSCGNESESGIKTSDDNENENKLKKNLENHIDDCELTKAENFLSIEYGKIADSKLIKREQNEENLSEFEGNLSTLKRGSIQVHETEQGCKMRGRSSELHSGINMKGKDRMVSSSDDGIDNYASKRQKVNFFPPGLLQHDKLVDGMERRDVEAEKLSRDNVVAAIEVCDVIINKSQTENVIYANESSTTDKKNRKSFCSSSSHRSESKHESKISTDLQSRIRPYKEEENNAFTAMHDFLNSPSDEDQVEDVVTIGDKDTGTTSSCENEAKTSGNGQELITAYSKEGIDGGNRNSINFDKSTDSISGTRNGEEMVHSTERKRKRGGEQNQKELSGRLGYQKTVTVSDIPKTLDTNKAVTVEIVSPLIVPVDSNLQSNTQNSPCIVNQTKIRKERLSEPTSISKRRAIECYSSGKLVYIFEDLESIGILTPFAVSGILLSLQGRQNKSSGFHWRHQNVSNSSTVSSSSNDVNPGLNNTNSDPNLNSNPNPGLDNSDSDSTSHAICSINNVENNNTKNHADHDKTIIDLTTVDDELESILSRSNMVNDDADIFDAQSSVIVDDVDELPIPVPLPYERPTDTTVCNLLSLEALLALRETFKTPNYMSKKNKVNTSSKTDVPSLPSAPL